jgi:hypothetical protein
MSCGHSFVIDLLPDLVAGALGGGLTVMRHRAGIWWLARRAVSRAGATTSPLCPLSIDPDLPR